MLSFNGNLKVYVALEPCDMRKSYNGLSNLVRNHPDLAMLTDGIDLRDGFQRPWYEIR